jgi:hypothetical protein
MLLGGLLLSTVATPGRPVVAAEDASTPSEAVVARADDALLLELRAGVGVDTLIVPPGQRRACVSHGPLYRGSLEVSTLDGRPLVPGVDYRPDEREGCLELTHVFADSTHLVARYRYVPLSSTRLHVRAATPVRDTVDVARTDLADDDRPDTVGDDGTRLEVGGSKTFSVEVGSNRDAALRQTLDLTIRGRLTRDVEIRGVLSDRDSPVTPEGTSAELDELDQVLIEVRSRNARATFGDIEVAEAAGEFGRYERRLEGASVFREGDLTRVGAVAASARGEFRSVELFGEEGKQGPYRIAETAGAVVGIVPGSEEVTLDGERLDRGQRNDYVIDYDLGEITFTPSRPITFDTRITVDFEAATESYRRSFLSAEAGLHRTDRLSVRALVVTETDDSGAPRGFSLSEEDEEILSEIGDESPEGEAVAVRCNGEGEYLEIDEGSGQVHYTWVGEDDGVCEVSFIRVGPGLGAYADSTLTDGRLVFVFRGEGNGDHAVGRRLAAPVEHVLGDLLVDYGGERVEAHAELAGSLRDRNTFSDLDDGDNGGLAGSARVRVKGPTWGEHGAVRVEGALRRIDEEFRPFTRITDSFDFLDWNYAASGLTEGEERAVAAVEVDADAATTLRVETGRLRSGNAFDADRVLARVRRTGFIRSLLSLQRTWNDGREEDGSTTSGLREVRRAEAQVAWARVIPRITYRGELTRTSGDSTFSGNRFDQVGADAELIPLEPLRLRADYSVRWDDRRVARTGNEWTRSSTTRDRGARVAVDRMWGVRGSVEYRRRTFEPRAEGSPQVTNLARIGGDALSFNGVLRNQIDYQVTTEEIEIREKIITFVGEGQGNYDQYGVFVGVGDYDLDLSDTGEREVLSRVDLSVRGSLTGSRGPHAAFLLREVRAQTFLRAQHTTRRPFQELLNPFGAGLYDTGGEAVEASMTLRQEASVFPARRVTPSLRYETFRSYDGRFDNVAEETQRDIVALRVRGTPRPGWTVEVEGSTEREEDRRERRVAPVSVSRDRFATHRGEVEVTHKPVPAWTMAGTVALSQTEKRGEEGTEERLEAGPRIAFAPPTLGRVEVRATFVEIDGRVPRGRPVFGLGLINQSGVEWSVLADFRVRENVTAAGTLRAVRPRGGETLYDGRMELRAFF